MAQIVTITCQDLGEVTPEQQTTLRALPPAERAVPVRPRIAHLRLDQAATTTIRTVEAETCR